jgi:hypothetical protein
MRALPLILLLFANALSAEVVKFDVPEWGYTVDAVAGSGNGPLRRLEPGSTAEVGPDEVLWVSMYNSEDLARIVALNELAPVHRLEFRGRRNRELQATEHGIIGQLTQLRGLSIPSTANADALATIAALEHLTELELFYGTSSGAALAVIAKLPNLTKLRLAHLSGITDTGLDVLGTLAALQVLQVYRLPDVGAAAFRAIASLPALRDCRIDLETCPGPHYSALADNHSITDLRLSWGKADAAATVAVVASMKSVKRLELQFGEALADEHVPVLAAMPGLRCLRLSGHTRLTGRTLGTLATSGRLEELFLWGCPISNDGIKQIGMLSSLRALSLNRATVADSEGLLPLRALTAMRELRLYVPQFDDAAAAILASMPELEALSIANTKVSSTALSYLSGHGALKSLNLRDCVKVGDRGLVSISDVLTLEVLEFRNTGISPCGIVRLKTLKRLKTLDVSYTWVTLSALRHLSDLPIEVIYAEGCPDLSWEYCGGLKSMKALQRIELGRDTSFVFEGHGEDRRVTYRVEFREQANEDPSDRDSDPRAAPKPPARADHLEESPKS